MTIAVDRGEGRVEIRRLRPEMDAGPGPQGRIGLIALSSDNVGEYDFVRILPPGEVACFTSRVTNANTITLASLKAMEEDLTRAARMIVPESRLDVFAYSCTSGTMMIGEERVFELLRSARPGVACTTPVTAAFAAFEKLGVRSVAVLTPYPDEINAYVLDYFEGRGITVVDFAGFGLDTDTDMGRVTPLSVRRAALTLKRNGADAIFVSCTGLRAVDAVAPLEAETGMPVVTSNQAMAWHAMRLAGYDAPVEGFGRLLRL